MKILDLVFVFPLRWLMGLLLTGADSLLNNPGLSILVLSVVVNTVLLPLYYLAEKWQNRERAVQKAMSGRLKEIKEQYRGEEQYNKTVELYKEFSYHPIQSLRTSFGFLIQVPFFLAAYTLLSHNPLLEGESFLFLNNLALPDGILAVGSVRINFMPILMTVLNLFSSFVYAKELTRGEKIKLVLIAFLFLVLLYKSPSGLVLYWTLNNLYSLLKNIIHNPVKGGA